LAVSIESIGYRTIALRIDAPMSGVLPLCAFRKIHIKVLLSFYFTM